MKSMWNLRMNRQRHSINLQPFSSFQSKSPPSTFLHPHRSTSNVPSSIKPSSNNPSTESSPSTTVETISSSTTSKTTSIPTTNFIYSPIFPPSSSGSDIFHQIDNDGNVVTGVVASTLHCPTSVATSLDATEIDAPPPRSIHAVAVYPPSTPSIHALSWILPSPSLTSAANVALADDDGWSKLPPSPAYSFNSTEPSHAQEERDFIAKLEATLPPNDFFRIPLALSKPWVGHCLWAFMGVVAVSSALLSDWDGMNSGHPHCFSWLQKSSRSLWTQFWLSREHRDQQEVHRLISERLKLAIAPSSVESP